VSRVFPVQFIYICKFNTSTYQLMNPDMSYCIWDCHADGDKKVISPEMNVNRRFVKTYCLHLRGWRVGQARNQHEAGKKSEQTACDKNSAYIIGGIGKFQDLIKNNLTQFWLPSPSECTPSFFPRFKITVEVSFLNAVEYPLRFSLDVRHCFITSSIQFRFQFGGKKKQNHTGLSLASRPRHSSGG
jgi:hypothetical protein